jgi:hypothetical protein
MRELGFEHLGIGRPAVPMGAEGASPAASRRAA